MATTAEKITSLETRLAAYKAAELQILTRGQSYTMHDIGKDYGNLKTVQEAIAKLENQIGTLEAKVAGDSGGHVAVFESPTT